MERRTASVDDTRQRIVDATMALHDEKGIVATSMQDIAARAGVALGTVYRHFPTMDDLIPACGGRNLELYPPPAPAVFADLEGPARVAALLSALYPHYEAMERPYFVGMAEAQVSSVLQSFMAEANAYLRSLVVEALLPLDASEQAMGVALAMADFYTWLAFHRAGFSSEAAAAMATGVVTSYLTGGPKT
jgi:AcrR family transcriptional regulator